MGNPGHCCGATTWVTRLAVIVAQHGFKLMRLTYISSDRRIESMQCFTFPILEVLFFALCLAVIRATRTQGSFCNYDTTLLSFDRWRIERPTHRVDVVLHVSNFRSTVLCFMFSGDPSHSDPRELVLEERSRVVRPSSEILFICWPSETPSADQGGVPPSVMLFSCVPSETLWRIRVVRPSSDAFYLHTQLFLRALAWKTSIFLK